MATKRINITDVFEAKQCDLCGSNEPSQFFRINENFIEFCGIYYPFREILTECLNFIISKEEGESMEICLDCKEKVLNFYHFKRKVKDAKDCLQKSSRNKKTKPQRHNKIVHSIYKIIENYTETCTISSVRIDKTEKRLIIESCDEDSPRIEKSRLALFNEDENDLVGTTLIKEEPLNLSESNFINESLDTEDLYRDDYDNEEDNLDESDIPASSSMSLTKSDIEPVKKRPKRERPKRRKENEYDIGTLELSVVDVINAFSADNNKFNDKYGDVFRKLMLSKYQTRIVVNFSFIGKSRVRVTVRCERCKDSYKIEGQRDDFINKVATQCSIWSTRTDFCRCGFFKQTNAE